MTFCLGVKVEEGLVGIADTRVTTGNERMTARKISVYQREHFAFFVMTSGLRSLRDKALTYFDEDIEREDESLDRLFKVVKVFATNLRHVAKEDKAALTESGLSFNIYSLIGGQLRNDRAPKLYLLYPQGGWVEVEKDTPYAMIGATYYGKPLLDRTLKYQDSLPFALKAGFLAFDATRTSTVDVGFPLDVVCYARDAYQIIERRYEESDLREVSDWWQQRWRDSLDELPSAWIDSCFPKLPSQ